MDPRLLAIYGSPRKGGNTEVLLDYFLEGVSASTYHVERVYLREYNFSHCTECDGCAKTGHCIVQDDMQSLYDKLLDYERVVISFPVFFLGPPALTKAFIDRGQALWIRKYVLGIKPGKPGVERKGFLISLCGFRGSGKIFSCNISIVRSFFVACGIKYAGEIVENGIDHRGDVDRHPLLKSRALQAGRDFVG